MLEVILLRLPSLHPVAVPRPASAQKEARAQARKRQQQEGISSLQRRVGRRQRLLRGPQPGIDSLKRSEALAEEPGRPDAHPTKRSCALNRLQRQHLDAKRARRESLGGDFVASERQVELDDEERAAQVQLYPDDPRQTVRVPHFMLCVFVMCDFHDMMEVADCATVELGDADPCQMVRDTS